MLQYRERVFNEVFDSQKIFRILLDSMSRPGKIRELPEIHWDYLPSGFNPGIFSVLKTLTDQGTTLFLDPGISNEKLEAYLFHNLRVSISSRPDADYAVYQGRKYEKEFELSDTGSIEFPEISTTILLEVDSIAGRPETEKYDSIHCYEASGPGIRDTHQFFISGMDLQYLESFKRQNRYFPCGINMMVIDQNRRMLSLPRTVRLEEKEWVM